MQKVLFCASRASHIENFHAPYLDYFRSAGWEVHTAAQSCVRHSAVNRSFAFNFDKNIFSPRNLRTLLRLAVLFRREKYTLILSQATLAGMLCKAALSGKNTRLVHISHGYLFEDVRGLRAALFRFCEKLFSKKISRLLVMNQADWEIAQKYKFAESIGLIPGMGIDKKSFPPLRAEEANRAALGRADSDFLFVYAAEFSKRKNHAFLIKAFEPVAKNHPDAHLLLAGEGALETSCKKLVETLGLENNVHFLGYCKNMNQLWRSCDAAVSTSRSEGLPFNILEAQVCGVPVLASRIKGHMDLIEDGENGLLFSLSAPDELTRAFERLLTEQSLYQKIKSKTVLCEKYSLESALPLVVKYYTEK